MLRIWDPVPFLPLDPGSGMGKNQDLYPGSESGMKIPDHISESLEIIFFWLQILKFFDADPDPGFEIFLTLDPGSGME